MTGFVLAWGWLALQLRTVGPDLGLPAGARVAGTLLMVLGGAIVLASAAWFVVVGGGTPAPFDAPRSLVPGGPYRWVRNPMYLGALILLVGFGLWHRSLPMALLALPAFGMAHLFVVLYEEPTLRRRFARPYEEYLARVNRWVPKPPVGGRGGALRVIAALAAATMACRPEPAATRWAAAAAEDSVFAGVQARGKTAMGVDQYTSTHVFESLPDGGRIVLQRDQADSVGTATIRAHLRHIARAFAAGDFQLPGFVHAQPVPGTAVMKARRGAIRYTMDTLPRGGMVRLESADSAAVRAIHQFMAFQRHDHRVTE
jgi:protein-S-isoprenylcysteine O-methyltransferase Ste14